MSPEFLACLEGYRSTGELESSGSFTLSDERAQKKLRDFTLSEPRLYVLNLQASAVAAQSSWSQFKTDADDLHFECDARLGSAANLEQLHSAAISDSASLPLRELALALNGCLALEPKKLSLEYWDGSSAATLSYELDQFVYSVQREPQAVKPGEPKLTFHLREKAGWRTAGKFFSNLMGAVSADSEQDAVARHCNYSPIPVSLNGQDIRRNLNLKGALHPFLVAGEEEFSNDHPLAQFQKLERRHPRLPIKGVLARGGRLAPWVNLIVHGVNFCLNEKALHGLRGVVYADFLRKDLSQTQLVQDESFRELMSYLSRFSV